MKQRLQRLVYVFLIVTGIVLMYIYCVNLAYVSHQKTVSHLFYPGSVLFGTQDDTQSSTNDINKKSGEIGRTSFSTANVTSSPVSFSTTTVITIDLSQPVSTLSSSTTQQEKTEQKQYTKSYYNESAPETSIQNEDKHGLCASLTASGRVVTDGSLLQFYQLCTNDKKKQIKVADRALFESVFRAEYFKGTICKESEKRYIHGKKITALASFPGSGNTWARLLLEQMTGNTNLVR